MIADAAEAIPDWAHALCADEWDDPDEDEVDDADAERLPTRGRRRRRRDCR